MRRRKDGLRDIDDIAILLKYLYMNEDAYVIVENSIGLHLKIMMNEHLGLTKVLLDSLTGVRDQRLIEDNDMTPLVLSAVVSQLKEQSAEQFPEEFENRWEEIKTITLSNLAINKMR